MSAFTEQDVDRICLHYTSSSVITVYDHVTGTRTDHTGLAGVRLRFEHLFENLPDRSDLAAPIQLLHEASRHEPGSAFRIWQCPASGYLQCTDTFIFDTASKIMRQNVVIYYKDPTMRRVDSTKNHTEVPSGSGPVHDGWKNYFEAFGGQDVEKILKGYVPESEITVYNHADKSMKTHYGVEGARERFKGLFTCLHDCSSLATPIIRVEEAKCDPQSIVGTWQYGTGTYWIEDRDGSLIFCECSGVYKREGHLVEVAGWFQAELHFLGSGNLHGTIRVRRSANSTLESSFQPPGDEEWTPTTTSYQDSGAKQVFLIWSCPSSGFQRATETFLFNCAGKITRQNVVMHHEALPGDPALAAAAANPYNARFQQTMLRIKDPRVSVPFYTDNFGMKLVHWIRFDQWGFTVYFLERQREGQTSPECSLEKTSVECEQYLWSMDGTTIELTHNHGSEEKADFKVWNGNTGKDAGEGPNYAEEPAARGFGHIAFNCDDVAAACERLQASGVRFQKKPDEGRMKGLAFALDPDGYWIEIVSRRSLGWPEYYNLSQTMLRVKDGPATVDFYVKHLGMRLVNVMAMPQYGFTNYFLVSCSDEEWQAGLDALPAEEQAAIAVDGGRLDPVRPNSLRTTLWHCMLELTWNHGTEKVEDFKVHDGNAQPQGFGHIGFLVDNLEDTCTKMEAAGVRFKKRPKDGNMSSLAFIYDPNDYSIELVDRGASFAGVCSNY